MAKNEFHDDKLLLKMDRINQKIIEFQSLSDEICKKANSKYKLKFSKGRRKASRPPSRNENKTSISRKRNTNDSETIEKKVRSPGEKVE